MKKIVSIIALTLFFAFKSAEDKPRIFLIGDSTCANKNPYDEPETGWGQVFSSLFTDAIEIQNHAVNGRSTKSFRTLGHWKKVSDQLHKGDYVFIQFGHNDQKESDTARYKELYFKFLTHTLLTKTHLLSKTIQKRSFMCLSQKLFFVSLQKP